MYLIDDILISDDIFEKKFTCNLDKCKGACCWMGDYGAPLERSEIDTIEILLPDLKAILSKESMEKITNEGFYTPHPENKGSVTEVMDNGACVFLHRDTDGIARCAIETGYRKGFYQFIKPISCHLYPLRISSMGQIGIQAINYDVWDICSEACILGKKLETPVFRFVKTALIRKYGQSFFEKLETVYTQRCDE